MSFIEYIAGFFDGEGCITIVNYKRKGRGWCSFVHVSITNTDRGILEKMRESMNNLGSIQPKWRNKPTGNKPVYAWEMSSRKAVTFLESILPYICLKTKQAKLALDFQKTMKTEYPLSEKTIEERHQMHQTLKSMNHRIPASPR